MCDKKPMPELPDVESFKRYLDATSLHQRIAHVNVLSAYVLKGISARELALRLKGRCFESSRRHGKHLFVHTDGDFRARMHPATEIADLDEKALAKLFRATRYILEKAIETKADVEQMPKSWLLPHRGKGGKCPRCGRELKSSKIGGRTAWFCSHCQRRA